MTSPAATPVIVPEQITLAGTTFYFKFRDLLPPLSWAEQASQREHMARHGIKVPVLLVERADGDFDVIDGINRLMNAMQLQIPLDDIPRDVHILTEDEQEDLALSLNFERRQLTGDQRQVIVLRLHERGKSQRAIADKLGTSAATVNRDLKAAGVSSETPEDATVTGKDGKQYPAVTEKTRVQQIADQIMEVFYDRKTGALHVDDLKRYGPQVSQELFSKALEFLMEDKRLATIGGGHYRRIFDNGPDLDHWCGAAPQIEAAIVETLTAFGPKKFHEVSQYLNSNWGQTAPHAFDAALNHLLDDGTVIRQAEDQHTLALAPIDPVTAEVTQSDPQIRAAILAVLEEEGPLTGAKLSEYITARYGTMREDTFYFTCRAMRDAGELTLDGGYYSLPAAEVAQEPDEGDQISVCAKAIVRILRPGVARIANLRDQLDGSYTTSTFTAAIDYLLDANYVRRTDKSYILTEAGKVWSTSFDRVEADTPPFPTAGAASALTGEGDQGDEVGPAQPSGAWKECAADIARYLGSDGPATRTTIRETIGKPYESATITQAFKFLLVRRYVREDPNGLAITNDGRTVYLRDQPSAEGAQDAPASDGTDRADTTAEPDASDSTPTDADEDAQVADIMRQVVHYLNQHSPAHNHAIKSDVRGPKHLIDRALYRLVKQRRVSKSHDRWYELIDADHKINIYLGYLDTQIKAVAKEVEYLPLDRLTTEQAVALREQIATRADQMLDLVDRLEALDAELHDALTPAEVA